MELFSGNEYYKLYQGSMLDMEEVIEPNSIDSIVTDPPYELNFMCKGWDNAGVSFQADTWKKCFNVLKPGGYLLAFGGSRTFHRIACAIEDAGFEIRDTIMWLYGCYSRDTQVLTNVGWKYFYDLDKTEKILQWDKDTNKLSWIKPLNYFTYDINDELCLFENRHISQLVTKNHNVAIKVKERRKEKSNYQLIPANEIKKSWILDFPLAGELDGEVQEDDAYIIGWWLTDAWKHTDGKAIMFSQSKSRTLSKLKNWLDIHNIKYSEYVKESKNLKHKDEHTLYITGDLADKLIREYPNRELNWDMLNWDKESRLQLLDGLMDGDGSYRNDEYSKTFWSKKQNRLDIFQALCISLNYRAYIGTKGCVNFNTVHNSTQTQTRHHKPNVKYDGRVYCLQTETGAFVVRRNGKAFISGNSGFPKSMNIGLAVDKKNGVESKVVGYQGSMMDFRDTGKKQKELIGIDKLSFGQIENSERKENPIYEAQNKWQGWGSCLKPAFEPIIVARKPFKGSLVDNVIEYGVGGINIDECRVETTDINRKGGATTKGNLGWEPSKKTYNGGRFPANVILTYDETNFDDVCGGFPNTNGGKRHNTVTRLEDSTSYGGKAGSINTRNEFNDSGSAARYFYTAKASKKDRDAGLEEFEEHLGGSMNGTVQQSLLTGSGNIRNNMKKNIHPTVKPTDLMQYLIRLVTPNGGTILDPFNGSGSTGKAAMYENIEKDKDYKYIGIELTEEYLPISQARIEYVINKGTE